MSLRGPPKNRPKPAAPANVSAFPAGTKMPPRNSNTMRVSGGDARGIRLKGPSVSGVRPTTERVRAAIFNILESGQVADRRVLDLFAGTGSLGIEALSRGAARADFVERNRRQSRDLQDNLAHAGFADAGRVHCADALRWLAGYPETEAAAYGLTLLDPPYRMGDPTPTLWALCNSGLLAPDATVVVGHSSRLALPERVGGLRQYDRRRYGDNAIAFYRYGPASPAGEN